MNYKMIARINALFLVLEAVCMIPALIFTVWDKDHATSRGFLISMGILLVAATALFIVSRQAKSGFYAKEGFVCVGIGWILISLFGSLPGILSGEIPHFADALFETVSGFTTTGSSILEDVEVMSRGINYWRCFTNWLGGMGVLVFLLAITPIGGESDGFTLHLLRAESPGPNVGKLVPKMRRTALILYLIYILLTVLTFVFLIAGRMPTFDALCTSLATAGTGGFGIKSDSIAGYSSYLQNVCTVFMLLFGVNFSCYYLILLRQVKNVFKDEEFRFYWGTVLVSTALIAVNVRGLFGSFADTLRHSAFQVASIVTTTGFCTTDFDQWPTFSKAILICLMAMGASAGSTGGGFKCARVLLLIKSLRRNIHQLLHPNSVRVIHVNGQAVDEKILSNTSAYFVAYILILIVSFLIVSLDSYVSVTSALTSTLSCLNNIGPAFAELGPVRNFAGLNDLSKFVLIFDMLAGRLEIFPILVLFSGNTWKRH